MARRTWPSALRAAEVGLLRPVLVKCAALDGERRDPGQPRPLPRERRELPAGDAARECEGEGLAQLLEIGPRHRSGVEQALDLVGRRGVRGGWRGLHRLSADANVPRREAAWSPKVF